MFARMHVRGGKVFAAVEDWANGHSEIASDSLIDNHTSNAAHKALGFTEVEVNFAERLCSFRFERGVTVTGLRLE